MTVAIVVPTVAGREQDLKRCLHAYGRTMAPNEFKLYVEHGHPSCGAAWAAGAEKAGRDGFEFLHFSADDLEPHDDWLDTAIGTVEDGYVPAPLVYHPDGTLDSAGLDGFERFRGRYVDWQLIDGTTVPFVSLVMWKWIAEIPGFIDLLSTIHYCTDLMVSRAATAIGWPTAIRPGMCFTHYAASAGRNHGRSMADTQKYIEWARTL